MTTLNLGAGFRAVCGDVPRTDSRARAQFLRDLRREESAALAREDARDARRERTREEYSDARRVL